jgi:hypothetical protein
MVPLMQAVNDGKLRQAIPISHKIRAALDAALLDVAAYQHEQQLRSLKG